MSVRGEERRYKKQIRSSGFRKPLERRPAGSLMPSQQAGAEGRGSGMGGLWWTEGCPHARGTQDQGLPLQILGRRQSPLEKLCKRVPGLKTTEVTQ